MTVREIAEAVGKKERAVRNWVVKAAAKNAAITAKNAASSPMKPADYDLDEACAIIEAGMGKNAAGIYRANAASANLPATTGPSTLTDRDMQIIGGIVAQVFAQLSERMGRVEGVVEKRAALLPAPAKEPRAELSQLVRKYATKIGGDHSRAWGELYQELYYRCHINVKVRATHEGIKPLDVIEREGLMDVACSIVAEMLGAAS